MSVRVLLFARARDLAGAAEVQVQLRNGARVSELRAALLEAFPALGPLLPNCLFAVNGAYAHEGHVLPSGAEVACVPPVSGG